MAQHSATTGGGGTTGTGNRTATVAPNRGDLIVVGIFAANNSQTAPTVSDDKGGGETYAQVPGSAQCTLGGQTYTLTVHVRQQFVREASGTTHTITATTGANDAAEIGMVRIIPASDYLRAGAAAIRSYGFANGASGTSPSATHNLTPLTENFCMFFVGSGDTTTTPPSGYTERLEAGQSTPTTRLEIATIDSGNTTATITAGATASTDWTCCVLEIDTSEAHTFAGVYPSTASEMATAVGYGTWSAGYHLNEASGNFAVVFGSSNDLVPSGSLTRQQPGAISANHAVALGGGTFQVASGTTYQPGTGDDQCMAWLIKVGQFSQPTVGQQNGSEIFSNTISGLFSVTHRSTAAGGGSSVTSPSLYMPAGLPGYWALVVTAIDRAANLQGFAVVLPGGNVLWSTADISSLSGLTIGNGANNWGLAGSDSYSTIDQAYVGVGSGIAAGMAANIKTAALNLWNYLTVLPPISGDASITLDALTTSATGISKIQGATAVTLDALTVSAAGVSKIAASASITLGALTTSATGTSVIAGAAAITLDALTTSAAGKVIGAATLSNGQLDDLALSATGTSVVAGAAAFTLGTLTTSATATAIVKAAAAITLSDLTTTATGTSVIAAAAAITLGDLTTSATGTSVIAGAIAFTLGDLTTSATGTSVVKAAATITFDELTTTATAIAVATGTAAFTLDDVTVSAVMQLRSSLALSITLDDLAVTATGVSTIAGTASITLDALTTSATGTSTIKAAGAFTLEALTTSATGVVIGEATLSNGQLDDMTVSAAAKAIIGVTAPLALADLAISAVGVSVIAASVVVTLGALTTSATGKVLAQAQAAIQLDDIGLDAVTRLPNRAYATIALDDLTATATATAFYNVKAALALSDLTFSATVKIPVFAAAALPLGDLALAAKVNRLDARDPRAGAVLRVRRTLVVVTARATQKVELSTSRARARSRVVLSVRRRP